MSLDLSDDEIHGLIAYARDKFGDEPYPFPPRCGRSGKPWPSSTQAGSGAARAEEAVYAEFSAAMEEQAAALSVSDHQLGV